MGKDGEPEVTETRTTKGAGFLGRQQHVVVRVFPLTSFSSFIREAVRRAAHIIIH